MGYENKGFTLLELMAVMAIIAILAGLGIKGYSLSRRHAKESRAKVDIEKLRSALNEYRIEFGRYPEQASATTIRELQQIGFLTNAVEGIGLVDPWGNDYQYLCTNRFLYSIWSKGQNADVSDDDIAPSKPGY